MRYTCVRDLRNDEAEKMYIYLENAGDELIKLINVI